MQARALSCLVASDGQPVSDLGSLGEVPFIRVSKIPRYMYFDNGIISFGCRISAMMHFLQCSMFKPSASSALLRPSWRDSAEQAMGQWLVMDHMGQYVDPYVNAMQDQLFHFSSLRNRAF